MFAVNVFGVQNCYSAGARQLIKQKNCKPDAPGKLIGVSATSACETATHTDHSSARALSLSNPSRCYPTTLLQSGPSEALRKPTQWRWQNTTSRYPPHDSLWQAASSQPSRSTPTLPGSSEQPCGM